MPSDLTFDATKLVFDPIQHAYAYGGVPQIGVSRVLELNGIVDKAWFTDYARDRGEHAHRAIELLDRNDLDEATLDPQLRPYVDAWAQFCADADCQWSHIEVPLCDPARGFAGKPDRIGLVFGEPAIADAKTGAHFVYHELQVRGGYARLAEACDIVPSARRVKCYGVYLTSDGKYSLREFKDPTALAVFDAARLVAQWKLAHLIACEKGRAA